MTQIKKITMTLSLALSFIGCAGPTTPFGADLLVGTSKKIKKSEIRKVASYNEIFEEDIKITSIPKSKLFHTNFNLSFIITNPNGIRLPFQYNILYNGKIVERWLKNEIITFNRDRTKATVMFKNISLLPSTKNEVTFLYYDKENHAPIFYELKEPECSFSSINYLTKLNPFNQKSYLIKEMNKIAKNQRVNPTLLASLVAQESSFNPKAVSIARAVGLTQVTPIADRDIRLDDPTLISYPNSAKLSYLDLKYKIYRGIINSKNDWRLNELKSLKGGVIYLKQLKEYWNNDYNKKFLKINLSQNKNTDIILASYNSGATRVKRNIVKYKNNWLWSDELGEARKYVNNIKSYCNHFNESY